MLVVHSWKWTKCSPASKRRTRLPKFAGGAKQTQFPSLRFYCSAKHPEETVDGVVPPIAKKNVPATTVKDVSDEIPPWGNMLDPITKKSDMVVSQDDVIDAIKAVLDLMRQGVRTTLSVSAQTFAMGVIATTVGTLSLFTGYHFTMANYMIMAFGGLTLSVLYSIKRTMIILVRFATGQATHEILMKVFAIVARVFKVATGIDLDEKSIPPAYFDKVISITENIRDQLLEGRGYLLRAAIKFFFKHIVAAEREYLTSIGPNGTVTLHSIQQSVASLVISKIRFVLERYSSHFNRILWAMIFLVVFAGVFSVILIERLANSNLFSW